jgi:hypothetical protein
VYVWIRCINHSVCMNQVYHLIEAYTMINTPDWCIQYDWHTWLIHTLWLTLLIDTYTMTDTPDWYIHYHWYIWLIYKLRLIHLIDTYTMIDTALSVCINQGYQSIVWLSIRCVSHSVCINQQYRLIYTLRLVHLIDTYTMIDTPDWYIHWAKHPLWLIHTLWVIHPLWLTHTLWLIHLVDTYTMIDISDGYIHVNQSGCITDSVCIKS